jgi:hypothetical protein
LIQLLKSVSIKSFVSTEAAHSTAAFLPVKLFFENFFSTQPLALPIRFTLLVSGRRILQRSNSLSTPPFPTSLAGGEHCEAEPSDTLTARLTH